MSVFRQPLDTGTATGRLMLAVIGAVAQAGAGSHAGEAGGGRRQGQGAGALPNALCRPLGGKAVGKSSGSTRRVLGRAEITSRLGIGRASVYRVLANHTGENPHAMVVTPPAQRQPSHFIRSVIWLSGDAYIRKFTV